MTGRVSKAMAARTRALGPKAEPTAQGTHWRLTLDDDSIAWLLLDRAGENTNTLSDEVLEELDEMLVQIEEMRPKGLVLRSAKAAGFIAGADVRDFQGADDAAVVRPRLAHAHGILERLEALPFPTIAVIHGFCLGGGLELALACRWRVAPIRGEEHSVLEAIQHELVHYAMHVGQIVFLAKHLEAESWESLSIPRGQSEKFFRRK